MADVLCVLWTIVPRFAPEPWLACSRCSTIKAFRSSHMIRVNANGKRLDAWLIYKCVGCDGTWNRPILNRRRVGDVDPDFLAALQANDPVLARRLAFDVEDLRRKQKRIEEFADVLVRKEAISEGITPRQLEIHLAVAEPTALRIDRLLATELGLARRRILALTEQGRLDVSPDGPRALRRPARDRVRLALDLSKEDDGDEIAGRAKEVPAGR